MSRSLTFSLLLVSLWAGFGIEPISGQSKDLEPWPAAEEGLKRFVIRLRKLEDESGHKVELIVGKTVEVDPVNRFFFGGSLKGGTVQGWGYSYHRLEKLGPMAGTRMGVPPGTPNKARFVTLGGEPYLVRYNSKLPLVIYAPEDCEVRYRLWKAGSTEKAAVE